MQSLRCAPGDLAIVVRLPDPIFNCRCPRPLQHLRLGTIVQVEALVAPAVWGLVEPIRFAASCSDCGASVDGEVRSLGDEYLRPLRPDAAPAELGMLNPAEVA